MTPDRAGFVLSPEQWENISAGVFQIIHIMGLESSYQESGVIDIQPIMEPVLKPIFDARLATEFTAGVEWGIKHMSQRTAWPLSWDAGFPGLKAQALIDRAAAIRNGKAGDG